MGGLTCRVDVGVSEAGAFRLGYDMEAMYGPEAAGMWMAYIEGAYEIEATDATSGKIWLMGADYVTGELTRNMYIEYSDLTETTCTFNCEAFEIANAVGTVCDEVVYIQSQGIGGW